MSAAGESDENKYANARQQCPHECKSLVGAEMDAGDEEVETILAQIEEMNDASKIEQLSPAAYEFWEFDLLIYWQKLEREFERNIWINLGQVAKGFMKG